MTVVGIDVGKTALDVAIFGKPKVHRFSNMMAGIRRLIRLLLHREDIRIVVEATGWYEEAVLAECPAAGMWIVRVNPRQAGHFARANVQLAKTDSLYARILAKMVQAFHARLRAHVPLELWQADFAAGCAAAGDSAAASSTDRQTLLVWRHSTATVAGARASDVHTADVPKYG